MSVERGRASQPEFLVAQKRNQFFMLLTPIAVRKENLRNPAPADVFDQNGLFFRRGGKLFFPKLAQQANCGQIVLRFLLEGTFTEPVGGGDAIIDERPMPYWRSVSGGRRR